MGRKVNVDIERVIEAWEGGRTCREIARNLGVSEKWVIGTVRKRLGVPGEKMLKSWRKEQREKRYRERVLLMRRAGNTLKEIARYCGIPKAVVWNIVSREERGGKKGREKKCFRCLAVGMAEGLRMVEKEEVQYCPQWGFWLCRVCKEKVEREGERALPKERRCLWCGEMFWSAGAAYRRCRQCERRKGEAQYMDEVSWGRAEAD